MAMPQKQIWLVVLILFVSACGSKSSSDSSNGNKDQTAPTVTASVVGGSYDNSQWVNLICNDGTGSGCATVYYTNDGTDASVSSLVYSDPIVISSDATLSFIAVDRQGNVSSPKSESYIINDIVNPIVSAQPATGYVRSITNINLLCVDGEVPSCASIYYTLDNSDPTQQSSIYSSPLHLAQSTTVKFIGVDLAGNISDIGSETYTIDETNPVINISKASGIYAPGETLELTCDDGNGSGCVAIYFTLNGDSPSSASTLYQGSITLNADVVVKAVAFDNAGNSSDVLSVAFSVDGTAPVISASVPAGILKGIQNVGLICDDGSTGSGCAAIYYTVNGDDPTQSSALYQGPLLVIGQTQIKAIAMDILGNVSSVYSFNYDIDSTGPTVALSIPEGLYNSAQNISLLCDDGNGIGCDQTFYSFDNQTFNVYSSPIAISSDTTFYYYAVDLFGTRGPTLQATYTFDLIAPTVIGSFPANGSTKAGVHPEILVKFSEPLSSNANFSVKQGAVTVPGNFSVNDNDLIFTADSNLNFSTSYTVQVGTSVTDIAGNHLAAAYNFSFTTLAAPTVISGNTSASLDDKKMVEDASGNRLEYWRENNGIEYSYRFRYYNFTSKTWTTPAIIPDTLRMFGNAGSNVLNFVTNGSDFLMVSNLNNVGKIRSFDGTNWGGVIELSPGATVYAPVAASNGNNYAVGWQVFEGSNIFFKVAFFDGVALSNPQNVNGGTNSPLGLNILSDGVNYAGFWLEQVSGVVHIVANTFDGSIWSNPTPIDTSADGSDYYTFTAGTGAYLVSWKQKVVATNSAHMNARVFKNNAWTTVATLDAQSYSGLHQAVATNAGFAILYSDGVNNFQIREYKNDAWQAPNPVPVDKTYSFNGISTGAKFASDGNGLVLIDTGSETVTGSLTYLVYGLMYRNGAWLPVQRISEPGTIAASPAYVVSDGSGYAFVWIESDIGSTTFVKTNSIKARVYRNGIMEPVTNIENFAPTLSSYETTATPVKDGYLVTWQQTDSTSKTQYANLYAGGVWSGPAAYHVPSEQGSAVLYSVTSNATGKMLAYWMQYNGGRWYNWASVYSAGNWTAPVPLSACSSNSLISIPNLPHYRIATNGNGFMLLCSGSSSFLAAYHYNGSAWETAVSISTRAATASYDAIASDTNGYMATWYAWETDASNVLHHNLYYNKFSNGGWEGENIAVADAGSGSLPNLTGDSNGYAMVWKNGSAPVSVNYSHFDGLAWGAGESINTSAVTGQAPVLGTVGGYYFSAWGDYNYLTLVNNIGGNWSEQTFTTYLTYPYTAAISSIANEGVVAWSYNGTIMTTFIDALGNGQFSVPQSVSSFGNANTPVFTASQNQFAGVWTQDEAANVKGIFAIQRNQQGWPTRQSQLESEQKNAISPGICAYGTGFRAFWSQPKSSDAIDGNAYRIWMSGEL